MTVLAASLGLLAVGWQLAGAASPRGPKYVVIAANDLGMHCMNQDFSELMILPPFNTFRATVIQRGEEPKIVTKGLNLSYSIPGNTHSTDKTNFWAYAQQLFGVNLRPNIGLAGNGMTGTMTPTGNRDWAAVGIPITPVMDNGTPNAYALGKVDVRKNKRGAVLATTQAVIPVSWEISCNLCHTVPEGGTVATGILSDHDRMHGTHLLDHRPVNCSGCHEDPALGAAGVNGIDTLSAAVHGAHASRVASLNLVNKCYACHPGVQTDCQRDVHRSAGIVCVDCHGSMEAVGVASRTPWKDEPKCGDCHNRAGFAFEQPGKLFKESVGHGNVQCIVCHSSPHAITPAVNDVDNVQTLRLQSQTGPLGSAPGSCTICHTRQPGERFFHHAGGDD